MSEYAIYRENLALVIELAKQAAITKDESEENGQEDIYKEQQMAIDTVEMFNGFPSKSGDPKSDQCLTAGICLGAMFNLDDSILTGVMEDPEFRYKAEVKLLLALRRVIFTRNETATEEPQKQ